jgi:hypothetical protein
MNRCSGDGDSGREIDFVSGSSRVMAALANGDRFFAQLRRKTAWNLFGKCTHNTSHISSSGLQ